MVLTDALDRKAGDLTFGQGLNHRIGTQGMLLLLVTCLFVVFVACLIFRFFLVIDTSFFSFFVKSFVCLLQSLSQSLTISKFCVLAGLSVQQVFEYLDARNISFGTILSQPENDDWTYSTGKSLVRVLCCIPCFVFCYYYENLFNFLLGVVICFVFCCCIRSKD